MATFRPKVLVACDERVREGYLPPAEIERLETFADWEWFSCEGGSIYTTNENPEAAAELSKHVGESTVWLSATAVPQLRQRFWTPHQISKSSVSWRATVSPAGLIWKRHGSGESARWIPPTAPPIRFQSGRWGLS